MQGVSRRRSNAGTWNGGVPSVTPARYFKKDKHQTAVVEYVRAHGYSVAILSSAPCGFDLLVGGTLPSGGGVALCVELKTGPLTADQIIAALTDTERKFRASWKGPYLATTREDAIVRTMRALQRHEPFATVIGDKP